MFAKDYSDGNPANNPGVPLKLKPTRNIGKNQNISRSSVKAVYNQVIKDLNDAESELKVQPPSYVYASKYAASAFLARVYMQMDEYKKALQEANKVIESGNYSLVKNYADEFNNPSSNTTEDIFDMQVSKQDGSNALQASYASGALPGGSPSFMVTVTRKFLNLYKPGDDRLGLFYKDKKGRWHTGKFKNENANVNLIRLAEMYLDRAECNKRLGKQLGATPTQDINTIRNRAGLPDLKGPVTLKQILYERKIELAFEGHFLFDIKRLHKSVDGSGTLWNSQKLVFPIPQREIDTNPNLKQNPGYGG